jgi:hypothetical protein
MTWIQKMCLRPRRVACPCTWRVCFVTVVVLPHANLQMSEPVPTPSDPVVDVPLSPAAVPVVAPFSQESPPDQAAAPIANADSAPALVVAAPSSEPNSDNETAGARAHSGSGASGDADAAPASAGVGAAAAAADSGAAAAAAASAHSSGATTPTGSGDESPAPNAVPPSSAAPAPDSPAPAAGAAPAAAGAAGASPSVKADVKADGTPEKK